MAKDYEFKTLEKVALNKIVRKIWKITISIILILVAILFLPWEQTIKGKGFLTALDPTERHHPVLAPVDGFIDKFYVKENQFVKSGEPLFKMLDLDKNYLVKLESVKRDLEIQIENTKIEMKNLENEISETKNILEKGLYVFAQKISQNSEKVKSLKFKQKAIKKNHEIEENNFERIKKLYQDGIESKREFEKSENIFVKAESEKENIRIEIEITSKNSEILQNEQQKFLSEIESKILGLKNKIVSVESRKKNLNAQLEKHLIIIERYKRSEVVAEKDGFVVRLFKNDKDRYIKKGEDILHFAPIVTEKSILLQVSDFNMPLVKEGLPVRIMFFGWPALQVSGWPKIQFGSYGGFVKRVEHISHDQGFYYAYVTEDPSDPWPDGFDLRIGSQATVWVRLSTVPIWYQLWRFMNAIPPKMVKPDREKF
jgi:adhesin transport system membrane fusion protein